MITLHNMRRSALVILAGSAFLGMAAASGNAARDMAPYLTRPTTAERPPDANGFIQRWLILEPIPANGLTDSLVQAAVKREHFPDQFTVIEVLPTLEGEDAADEGAVTSMEYGPRCTAVADQLFAAS